MKLHKKQEYDRHMRTRLALQPLEVQRDVYREALRNMTRKREETLVALSSAEHTIRSMQLEINRRDVIIAELRSK